jgi:hypothetical protein
VFLYCILVSKQNNNSSFNAKVGIQDQQDDAVIIYVQNSFSIYRNGNQ